MNVKALSENDLLKQNTHLVSAAVRHHMKSASQLFSSDHLHGLGLIALLEAVRHYPATRSQLSFETYARVQIHSAMAGEIRRAKSWITSDDLSESIAMTLV